MTDVALVLVPANQEGTRATVLRWCKAVGDTVAEDEALVELETDKVTVEVPSPVSGTLVEILKQVDAEVNPDEVLAKVRLTERAPAAAGSASAAGTGAAAAPDTILAPSAADTSAVESSPLSPAVRRLLREHALAPADIRGSGRDGRITAQDVERRAAEQASANKASADTQQADAQPADTQRPHSAMRRRIAEHMVRSVAVAPHVTTLFEADLTRVLAHRKRHMNEFEQQGVRLTLTAYFVAAAARALREHPEVNASFLQDALALHAECNIGVGTALGSEGLIVPVIHGAQRLSLSAIARRLGEVVAAARDGKLTPADVRGGTFTISNHGVSGSLLAAPIIINQPQVAILGIGKVERRVGVVETAAGEAVGIRSMCFLTLTIDHRALDAFQANAFLSKLVGILGEWPDA
ncbi:MAG TPA: 2-oxo acid dehydrogenase subunit E2 [Steroidobacteraceae bacterium]|nr:2-oxo acid dehydrogenase subunit E2 [Steroidobacteraceae bacterium]